MKINRIYALMMRHILLVPRDLSKITTLFYWPAVDIVLWGFAGQWMHYATQDVSILISWLMCLLFWQIIWRSNIDVSGSLLEEIWSHNVANIFASPLTLGQWLISAILLAFIFVIICCLYCAGLIYWIYNVPLWHYWHPSFILIAISLFIAGVSLSLIALAGLLVGGQRIESFKWMITWLFAPVSGVFYPINVLPPAVQVVAKFVPMSYTFTALRNFIMDNVMDYTLLIQGLLVSILYFSGALLLVYGAFRIRLRSGISFLDK